MYFTCLLCCLNNMSASVSMSLFPTLYLSYYFVLLPLSCITTGSAVQHMSLCWLVSGVEEASRVLEWAERDYPDSALFLYFKSRILRLQVPTLSCTQQTDHWLLYVQFNYWRFHKEEVLVLLLVVAGSVSADSCKCDCCLSVILLTVWYWGVNGCLPTSFGNEWKPAWDSAHMSLWNR